MKKTRGWIALACVWSGFTAASFASVAEAETFPVRDTLDVAPVEGEQGTMLTGLRWKPQEFTTDLNNVEGVEHQAVLRFPSAITTNDDVNDRVALVWYRGLETQPGKPVPAIIVVHESGSAMPVGKLFARSFAAKGVHAFLIHLPHYGLRRRANTRPTDGDFFATMKQAIADVRRARDVVAALPGIDANSISLQGTSLGGFVSATVAGVDRGFDATFIMLAGGDLVGLLKHGEKEAAQLRTRLEQAGYTGEKLENLLATIEPVRLANRMNSETTWLYSAQQDRVVPLANVKVLQQAARIPESHHISMWGDHTSTVVYFPAIVQHVVDHLPGRIEPESQQTVNEK